jgi:hypothetical protein
MYHELSGRLAQLAEQLTLNQRVTGSIPVSPSTQSLEKTQLINQSKSGGTFSNTALSKAFKHA